MKECFDKTLLLEQILNEVSPPCGAENVDKIMDIYGFTGGGFYDNWWWYRTNPTHRLNTLYNAHREQGHKAIDDASVDDLKKILTLAQLNGWLRKQTK